MKMIKPNVYIAESGYADISIIQDLIRKAELNKSNLTRLCLHANNEAQLMAMIIVVRNKYIYPPHRHLWKDESYTIYEGSCIFKEFDSHGMQISELNLKKGDTYINAGKNFHCLEPLSDILCFAEHTVGPFTGRPLEFL